MTGASAGSHGGSWAAIRAIRTAPGSIPAFVSSRWLSAASVRVCGDLWKNVNLGSSP